MKAFKYAAIYLLFVAALFLWATPARAQMWISNRSVVIYDSGDVAAGAVINSPNLDLSTYANLIIYCRNADGVATRALTMAAWSAVTGGQNFGSPSFTCGTGSFNTGVWYPGAITGTGVVFAVPAPLPPMLQITLAAGGSSVGRVIVMAK